MFLKTICASEGEWLEASLEWLFFEETMRLKLADVFSQCDTMGIPNPFSLKDLLQSVASFVKIEKPFCVVGNTKVISDFNQISEENFLKYLELIKHVGKAVAEQLYGDFSEDANLSIHEERVFYFVEKNTVRHLVK